MSDAVALQSCWDSQDPEEGAIILGVMQDGSVSPWVSQYGITYPLVYDPSGVTAGGINGGYPTYPVIGADMTIQNNDLFPFNCGGLSGYL